MITSSTLLAACLSKMLKSLIAAMAVRMTSVLSGLRYFPSAYGRKEGSEDVPHRVL